MITHPMVTRAKAGIFKPLERMNFHVTTTLPLPRSHVHALRDPNWKEAMLDKYNALITNRTWDLVPRPANVNVVRSMWLFKHKFNVDGSLSSLVVKPATIHTILSLAVFRNWPIHQLDVKKAFLHGHLSETVYMHQPPGFVDPNKPDYVCHLQRSLYGFKQAPRRIIASLRNEFAMKDLGSLIYFLGISAQRSASGLFLSQSKFAEEILERAHMQNYNPCRTLVDTESKLGSDGDPVSNPTLYYSLASALQNLTFTRPDLSYVVQQVCLYMYDPRDLHFTALKHILFYVRGTLDYGLQLHVSSTTLLSAYTDADRAGCLVTRRFTFGYCVFLGDNLLSWSAKPQVTLSCFSAEAEYRGVANVVTETAWIRNLLCELYTPLFTTTLVYCDNVSDVYMSANLLQHQRTKHIKINIHFIYDFVASGQVRVLHVLSRLQYADIFTKGLPTALFSQFASLVLVQLTGHTNMFNSEPQATILPQAFQTMTAQDPSWNIDTRASSHLADNIGKHAKLPFNNSECSVPSVFEIIHSNI
ncbi:ribonuclease H-like domain-containing protein [Tanacetum coccineum]